MSTQSHRSRRRVLVLTGALMLLRLANWANLAAGQGTSTPVGLMSGMAAAVTAAVKADPSLLNATGKRSDEATRRFSDMYDVRVLPYIDFMRITALATGRSWRVATLDQQTQLARELRELIVSTDAVQECRQLAAPGLYDSPAFHTGDENAVVYFHPADRPQAVQAEFRVELTPAGWKVMDIQLGGTWLVESYKQVFAQQIARVGIDGLIQYLSDRNRALSN